MMQLPGFEKRYPSQLSGGQRQRVALARALAIEPRVLLLDEPFGALDAKVRKDLRKWLRDIHDRTGLTTVFVTHDQAEAMEVADRVAILNAGRIEQIGAPDELRARARRRRSWNSSSPETDHDRGELARRLAASSGFARRLASRASVLRGRGCSGSCGTGCPGRSDA